MEPGSRSKSLFLGRPANTVSANVTLRNRAPGIEAVAGVIDGGGNRAFGNGDPLQCLRNALLTGGHRRRRRDGVLATAAREARGTAANTSSERSDESQRLASRQVAHIRLHRSNRPREATEFVLLFDELAMVALAHAAPSRRLRNPRPCTGTRRGL
jgi:hypothetical protein